MVGMTGFEPATSCSQSRRATNCATSGMLRSKIVRRREQPSMIYYIKYDLKSQGNFLKIENSSFSSFLEGNRRFYKRVFVFESFHFLYLWFNSSFYTIRCRLFRYNCRHIFLRIFLFVRNRNNLRQPGGA